jgi:GAF domain-containing protein
MLLNPVGVCVARGDARETTARAICDAIASARGYDFVGLYDVTGDEIAVVGWSGDTAPAHPRFSAAKGLCGAAAKSGATVIANDVAADPRYLTTSDATCAEMIVPVVDPVTREVLGTIDVASNRRDAFGPADRELIEDCASAIHGFWTEKT